MRKNLLVLACVTALAAASVPGATAAEMTVETLDDYTFSPDPITVTEGDTVIFKNTGKAPHNAVAEDGSFNVEFLNPGESQSVTIKGSGEIAYVCTFHETLGMKGTIVISSAAGAPPATGSTSPTPVDEGEVQAPPVGAGVPGEGANASPSPAVSAADEAAAAAPPSQKYFPMVSLGLLALVTLAIGASYVRMAIKTAENRS